MTYVVEALRHTVDGGTAPVAGLMVLTAYGIVAFGLTVLAAGRSRRLTPALLHPELVV
jgi:putative membrane protein